jgi:magnesium transporter
MSDTSVSDATHLVVSAIRERDRAGVTALLGELSPADAHLLVSRLDAADQKALLEILDPAGAAKLVLNFRELLPHRLLSRLPTKAAAAILGELPSNVRTSLVAAMKSDDAGRILAALPKRESESLLTQAQYPPDVAGGLMETAVLSYPQEATIEQVVADLRTHAERYAKYVIQYIYVTRDDQRLSGVIKIRDLLLGEPTTQLSELAQADPVTVDHLTPLDELRDLFDHHRFLGLPVVDDGRLVGVIRRGAVEAAIARKTASQFRLVQGIIGGEEVRTMPVRVRSGRRLAWLSANIVLNVIAASVIVYFESTLARLIALAAFLPIISDMSGCSGNQAVAVSMRELSLGLVRPREVLRVWRKEVGVGLINGMALGVLIGLVAWLWRGNPTLGLVVGAALALNTVVAVSIGGCVPLILKGFGVDPALASGPILTTVTDICGFFFALGLASFALSQGYL